MATPDELLDTAIQAMADLHNSMTPDGRAENALVPPAAFRQFVDAHARLLYERERMASPATAQLSNELATWKSSYNALEKQAHAEIMSLTTERDTWRTKHAALEEAYQKKGETAAAMISHRDGIINGLRARIAYAPAAFMDTRDVLGICAPEEEDFSALYALQGKRVRLVLDDETPNLNSATG